MRSIDFKTIALRLTKVLPLTGLVLSFSANAQYDDYKDRHVDSEPYISIYEHCGFRGERRDISVGEFQNMRELDFGNDRVSSIQVPPELEAVIFEHDRFKGDYARIGQDVRCFDENWNDQVSSLRVKYSENRYQSNKGPVYGGRDRDSRDPAYGGRDRDNVHRDRGDRRVAPKSPDTRIAQRCFNYNVYTNGKSGGIRFSNGKDFYRFKERGHQGRICHRGELVVEINKRDFDTDVTLDIEGRQFKFSSGERETQYRASWYRKVIKLQVGR